MRIVTIVISSTVMPTAIRISCTLMKVLFLTITYLLVRVMQTRTYELLNGVFNKESGQQEAEGCEGNLMIINSNGYILEQEVVGLLYCCYVYKAIGGMLWNYQSKCSYWLGWG